uniref:Uncharacterized protein n=1 Tax=Rhizophora mucronata TaxID=61149 RepID=A0A2P2JIQ6_RHIMU
MANQGAKKRKEENARHMAMLSRLIFACNVIKSSSSFFFGRTVIVSFYLLIAWR